MREEIDGTGLDEGEVLLAVLLSKSCARDHLGRRARVELERAYRAHEHGERGTQARGAALDVEELLAAHVGAESRLCKDIAVLTDELESELISDDRGVAVGDVGKGPAVDEGGGALEGLHCRRHKCIHEQDLPRVTKG